MRLIDVFGEYILDLFVTGQPVSKQSFRFNAITGKGYQKPNIIAWQNEIGYKVREVWRNSPTEDSLKITLIFVLKRNSADIDNLTKCVLDGLQGVLYKNDKQVMELTAKKEIGNLPGVYIKAEIM